MLYVWIAIAIVAVAVLVTLLVLSRKRKLERDRAEAGQLRAAAQAHTGDIVSTQQEVEVRAEDAAIAHEEAKLADERLAEAERELAQAEAKQEDVLRAADRLDPHRKSDELDISPAPTGSHRKEV
ncbi:hypothetical protein [Nocardioides lianchengensis]|uniref:Uncharacterized protein n=1 Tax=Nocardioides lianchengensis TaxID=1045774 RepID=A0A1G7AEH5_9ACTN|nr:hypothetical protein [Nocardioides lianchengensis]NYG13610.1 heme exporter protein D [Nocardioides lianchengensis]SDE13212.1 hypothetical protein SAMN05421872_11587 [Nocardioides lianchengensis]